MAFVEGIPTIELTLDKPRRLAFTQGSMLRVLARVGTLGMPKEDDLAGRLRVLPMYIWACLDSEGRAELSVEQVEDMIYPGNQQAMQEALDGLMVASSPEAAADAPAVPTQPGPKLASAG